jgi:thiol-disulfide isomerase/thioredoxin
VVEGTDFAGNPVAIKADGRPKAIIFLAHWCPHCQAEVPVIQAWVNAGWRPGWRRHHLRADRYRSDPAQLSADAWFEREGWTLPVLVDPTNSVAQAYGLTLYPFWVFVGPDGKVVMRTAGEMTMPDLEAMLRPTDRQVERSADYSAPPIGTPTMLKPPSTKIVSPVTALERSEAR